MSDISDGLPTGYTREKRPATRLETVEAILDKSARRIRAVPLQRAFIQSGERKEAMPGPLARFVSRHDDTALRGYLLALAGASAPPFDIKQPADVWARALDLDLVGVSKMWARLERLGLIGRRREGRRSVITILREDGSGLTYTHPFLLEPKRPYVKIPDLDPLRWTPEHLKFQSTEEVRHGGQDPSALPSRLPGGSGPGDARWAAA